MTELWSLFLTAAFVDNMPLTLFLGLCTFLALSKRPEAALGLGIAMTGVLGPAKRVTAFSGVRLSS